MKTRPADLLPALMQLILPDKDLDESFHLVNIKILTRALKKRMQSSERHPYATVPVVLSNFFCKSNGPLNVGNIHGQCPKF